jgi:hypothetical protein
MRIVAASSLLLLCVGPLSAQDSAAPSSQPTREQIAEAIARGTNAKRWEGLEIKPSGKFFLPASSGFTVTIEGPLNRVASEAGRRAKRYLPYTVDSVAPGLLDSLFVVATPLADANTIIKGRQVVTPAATHLVLAATGDGNVNVFQPTKVETFDVEVTGIKEDGDRKAAPRFQTKGIRAWFSPASLPSGPFEIRVITDDKEFKIVVDSKQRVALRH